LDVKSDTFANMPNGTATNFCDRNATRQVRHECAECSIPFFYNNKIFHDVAAGAA
jgi:hypothetical protein